MSEKGNAAEPAQNRSAAAAEAVDEQSDDELIQRIDIHECRAEVCNAGGGNLEASLQFIENRSGNGDSLHVGEKVKE